MSSCVSSQCTSMENPAILTLLHQAASGGCKQPKSGKFLRMFKLFPMLTAGCKMVAHLGRPRKSLPSASAVMIGTLFGHRKGRVNLAIQEDPKVAATFVIELPISTTAFQKEMATGLVRIALESEGRSHKKWLMDELIWAVYCNGRKMGYSVRRKQPTGEEAHVIQLLRGVSAGAGVLPSPPPSDKEGIDGELMYMRARFERVVGCKDSEALYMVNPDGNGWPELSIFFVRVQ